ncbi:chromosome segregation protein SMC [Wukongibacter baidiensis]|uniref:chromosome segregation protein SMC n=1 Tax=Wukongibacter baidiensis TaxID=1723361 RepID=UPI003D7FA49A
MYLKKLEAHGFKSFADKIEIDFKNGITGIVGPNGSGKSNVIDSVRWVLGEQSPKTLRGSRMEDIIFNGTTHRKPLGAAEVSLTFNNSEKFLPIDYSEVTITRRLYRSGESEYLINKTPCRLRDIRELLMDTGIGIDGYSLIGQGQIDSILSNKPDERRQLFEEAAGIVKFKSRKSEAEKKLNNTNQNLLRIEDILGELELRIGPLKIQSEKAKTFLELSEELKELELNLFLKEIDDVKLKLKSEEEQLSIVRAQHTDYLSKKENIEGEQIECQKKIDDLQDNIQSLKDNFYEIKNLIKQLEGDRVLYQEKIQNIQNNMTRIESEVENISSEDKNIHIELSKLLEEKEQLESLLAENNELLISENSKYDTNIKLIGDKQDKLEALKSKVIEILNLVSSTKSEVNSIKTMKDNIENRIRKIKDEKQSISDNEKENLENLKMASEELEKIRESYKEKTFEKEKLINSNNDYTNKHRELLKKYEIDKNNLRDMQSQRKLLDAMEKSYEGFSTSVRKTLQICKNEREIGKGVHGVVAELMSIPKEYEIAMEVALGYSMQNIVCNDEGDAKRIIKYLKKNNLGRVTFFPLSNVSSWQKRDISRETKALEGYIGVASELISCSKEYSNLFTYLLGKTLIVDNIDSAVKISKSIKKYKIVTLDGDVINPGGTITGGSYKSKIANVFSRKRRLSELEDKISDLSKLTVENEKDLEALKNKIEEVNEKLKSNSASIEETKLMQLKQENIVMNIKNQGESLGQSMNNLKSELDELKVELEDMDDSVREKEVKIKELESENLSLQENIKEINGLVSDKQEEADSLKEYITGIKVKSASIKGKRENSLSEIDRIKNTIEVWKNNRLSRENELKELETEKEMYIEELEKIQISINDNDILSKQIDYNINKYTEERNVWNEKNKDLLSKIDNIDNALDDLKESLHKIEVKKARLELQHDNYIKKIWEKYELSYMDALDHRSEIENLSKASSRINYLNKEVKKLGEVNLSSIKEYEEVNERYSFLNSQKEDLIKAKDSLDQVIRELEATMKKQFVKSFHQINENFSVIFNQLFSGGKAKLVLDDSGDVLEGNIEIIAQPPGKKLQNLTLLSGGEKALTAIALLFSILRTKPTPFCILDEIEAALDDVNIFRFAEFLREFSKNSQFIVITHRKGTMEIIDYLYGITMQEYGVSKVVSVKLSDVAS